MKKLIILSPSEIEIVTLVARKITRRGKDNISKAVRFIINEYWSENQHKWK
jgi:hypothetical protein